MIPRIALGLMLTVALPATAALPPQYQRAAELQAIIASPEVAQKLRSRPIDAIERVSPDLYRVRADQCRVDVRITNDPAAPPMPGPRRFLLVVGDAICS